MILGDSLAQVAKDTTILKEVIVNVADTVTNYVYIKEVPVSDGWSTDTWINLLSAGITFLAVLVAFGGKEFINWWNRIQLDIIDSYKIFFEPIIDSPDVIHNYFKCYLKVNNKKGKILVENARVNLLRISERINNKPDIHEITKEAKFMWHTLEEDTFKISFLESKLFCFGFLCEINETWKFVPLYKSKEDYLGKNVCQNQIKIYELEIESDNYISNRKFYFQVYYNSKINYDLENLKNHLQITRVNGIDDFREPIKYEDN